MKPTMEMLDAQERLKLKRQIKSMLKDRLGAQVGLDIYDQLNIMSMNEPQLKAFIFLLETEKNPKVLCKDAE